VGEWEREQFTGAGTNRHPRIRHTLGFPAMAHVLTRIPTLHRHSYDIFASFSILSSHPTHLWMMYFLLRCSLNTRFAC
jgi:hypothetical protein